MPAVTQIAWSPGPNFNNGRAQSCVASQGSNGMSDEPMNLMP